MEILHLALLSDWQAALASGAYRVSTRDASLDEVGFIHSSTAAQLPGVAEAFYADETRPLVVLVMDDEAIRASGVEVVFEDAGDGQLFPHVYGPIDPSTVTDVRPASFDDDGHLTY